MTQTPPSRRAVRDMFRSTAEMAICPTGADPLTMMVLRAEAECDRLGWGGEREAPLRWFWLHDQGPLAGSNLTGVAMGLADMGETLDQLHPLQLVQALEAHMTTVDRDLIGFILVSEGWMVTWAPEDQATRARAIAAAGRREIWRQPDRVETRLAHLQMLTGQHRHVLRVRGQDCDPQSVGPLPGGEAGELPPAMYRLATTLRRRKYGRRG